MVKIKVEDQYGKERMLLINPEAIVTVERQEDNSFEVHLVDGRIFKMSEKMFEENFAEEEVEEECDECKVDLRI